MILSNKHKTFFYDLIMFNYYFFLLNIRCENSYKSFKILYIYIYLTKYYQLNLLYIYFINLYNLKFIYYIIYDVTGSTTGRTPIRPVIREPLLFPVLSPIRFLKPWYYSKQFLSCHSNIWKQSTRLNMSSNLPLC